MINVLPLYWLNMYKRLIGCSAGCLWILSFPAICIATDDSFTILITYGNNKSQAERRTKLYCSYVHDFIYSGRQVEINTCRAPIETSISYIFMFSYIMPARSRPTSSHAEGRQKHQLHIFMCSYIPTDHTVGHQEESHISHNI